jgi:hypothetical protein
VFVILYYTSISCEDSCPLEFNGKQTIAICMKTMLNSVPLMLQGLFSSNLCLCKSFMCSKFDLTSLVHISFWLFCKFVLLSVQRRSKWKGNNETNDRVVGRRRSLAFMFSDKSHPTFWMSRLSTSSLFHYLLIASQRGEQERCMCSLHCNVPGPISALCVLHLFRVYSRIWP